MLRDGKAAEAVAGVVQIFGSGGGRKREKEGERGWEEGGRGWEEGKEGVWGEETERGREVEVEGGRGRARYR